ncbi:TetR/AcrR family transcriptional regulator [Rhodoferax sp. U11-2br]|uniref:TetR/AcrR family transcriptional regulator n=1 Tax=Rhodoferax sp. U11-2br TaxID=2838878 RepID=UPI001BE8E950|nr:TetR/AcrR family transcriptional regulator [Rhodoferax sp. U11-2br]MBT3066842.1 TetR/AcrR family transcriptional regulator [Rhodoferax sp. U11-2br]
MRAKTETRRQAILAAAEQVFQETGFAGASMAQICQRVGYSKATLYSYFSSKEELFFEVISKATEAEFQATHDALDANQPDMAQALETFGRRFLSFLYAPQLQTVRRLVVSEAGRSGLGQKCFELGPQRSEAEVVAFLQHGMATGKLRQANTRIAARQFKSLLEAEWIDRFMFQMPMDASEEAIAESVHQAITVFMRAYGPETTTS